VPMPLGAGRHQNPPALAAVVAAIGETAPAKSAIVKTNTRISKYSFCGRNCPFGLIADHAARTQFPTQHGPRSHSLLVVCRFAEDRRVVYSCQKIDVRSQASWMVTLPVTLLSAR